MMPVVPMSIERGLFLLGAQGKSEECAFLCQLKELFPGAVTIDELKQQITAVVALKAGLDTALNGDLSTEQIRAKLGAMEQF